MKRTNVLWVCAVVASAWVGAAANAQNAQNPGAAPPRSPRLYVLEGGVLESDPGRYDLADDEVAVTQLSIAAYLVVHPQGVLLWDAAAIADAERVSDAAGVVQRVVRTDGQERIVTLGPPLLAQLAESGFSPDDVTHLALSHYHWDHTANANAFSHATWLVRPADRERMFAGTLPGGTRPSTYSALSDSRTVLVTSPEHDVFGDGSVVLRSAPGHTEGHQVLYVALARTGPVVLSGDLYHYPEERTLNRLPDGDVDVDQTAMSRRELEAFLSSAGAQLWVQHDLVAHRALKKAPAFYE